MIQLNNYIALLKNRHFTSLWLSQIASEIAYHVVTFTLVVLLYQETGATIYVTWLVALVALAPILFSMFAGIIADSFDRKLVMLASHACRIVFGVIMLFLLPYPLALIPIAFLLVSAAQFFEPAQVSSIPALVEESQLFTANSYFSFTRYTMFLVGYTAAGPLLAHTSAQWIFIIVIGLYLFALLNVLRVRPLREHITHDGTSVSQKLKETFWQLPKRIKEGIAFMLHDNVVKFLLFQVSFIFAIERAFIALAPSFALDWLKISVQEISLYLILPTGLGTLTGTLTVNIFKKKMSRNAMVTFGTLLDGFCLIALAMFAAFKPAIVGGGDPLTITLFLVAILAFLSGFADPYIIVPAQTVVQERTPPEKRGRIFGNLVLLMNLLGIIPIIAIGFLSTYVSVVSIITALGILVVIVGIFGLFYWRKFRLEQELQAGA